MPELTFDEAVEGVKLIQRVSEFAGHDMAEYIVTDYARAAPADRPTRLRDALHFSKQDGGTWDAVNSIAQQYLRSGGPLPRELAEWITDRLEGKQGRPGKQGQRPTTLRDTVIASAVQALVKRGFRPTRNRPSGRASAEGGSACDAVGVALDMGYKTVEGVWTDSKRIHTRELLRPGIELVFTSYQKQEIDRTTP